MSVLTGVDIKQTRVKALESVSIVTGVRNRTANLLKALPTWLCHPCVKEVVIVDWSSTEPVWSVVPSDSRIRILSVQDVPEWNIARCINFAVSQVKETELIVKLDADIILDKGFFEGHAFDPETEFIAGDYKAGEVNRESKETEVVDPEKKYTSGVFLVARPHFLKVNGFPECCIGYGYDELSLYNALVKGAALRRKALNKDLVNHLSHSDTLRGSSDLELATHINMFLCDCIDWHSLRPSASTSLPSGFPWTPIEFVSQVEKPTESKCALYSYHCVDFYLNHPPKSTIEACINKAKRCILNKHGVTWMMTCNKTAQCIDMLYEERLWPKLHVFLLNGLGNRVRALASAAVLANEHKRMLIAHSYADTHFDASFSSLFDCSEFLIVTRKEDSVIAPNVVICRDQDFLTLDATGIKSLQTNCDVQVASYSVLQGSRGWSREVSWIKQYLKPVPSLMRALNDYAISFNIGNCIGMHIRMSQPTLPCESTVDYTESAKVAVKKARRQSHWYFFALRIRETWRATPKQCFLICCDNAEAQDKMMNFFERDPRLFVVPKVRFDRSAEQLQGAVLDAWLLSKCKSVWGSPWSSFSELVCRIRCGRIELAGVDFARRPLMARAFVNTEHLLDAIEGVALDRLLGTLLTEKDKDSKSVESYTSTLFEHDLYVDTDRLCFVDDRGTEIAQLEDFDLINVTLLGRELERLLGRLQTLPWTPLVISVHLGVPLSSSLETRLCGLSEKPNAKAIGVKDVSSWVLLKKSAVKTWLSGSITSTLAPWHGSRKGVYIIRPEGDLEISDLKTKNVEVASHLEGKAVLSAHFTKQKYFPRSQKRELQTLLEACRTAEFVITSHKEVGLACAALGTPFHFFCDEALDSWMESILVYKEPLVDITHRIKDAVEKFYFEENRSD